MLTTGLIETIILMEQRVIILTQVVSWRLIISLLDTSFERGVSVICFVKTDHIRGTVNSWHADVECLDNAVHSNDTFNGIGYKFHSLRIPV